MSGFTLAYLARLQAWGLTAALVEGALVMASWLAWSRATASATPNSRCGLASAHLVAMAGLPVTTVAVLHWTIVGASDGGAGRSSFHTLTGADEWAGRLAPAIAIVWLSGAAWMLLSLLRDLLSAARLRAAATPSSVTDAVHSLAGVWAGAGALEALAANVSSPQVVGVVRPKLLVPHGFATELTAAERDAVLLHELAHLRRGDFGWNLVQRIVLALAWFHPGAWVIYGALSREREACCDAMAVRWGARPADLARALLSLAETDPRSAVAMGWSNGSDLPGRVRRLVGADGRSSASRSAFGVAVTVTATCVASVAFGRLGLLDASIADLCNASALGPTVAIVAHDPAGAFALKVRHGQVLDASIGDRPVPRARILQRGDHVVVLDATQTPLLAVTVTPQGHIRWAARS